MRKFSQLFKIGSDKLKKVEKNRIIKNQRSVDQIEFFKLNLEALLEVKILSFQKKY